MKKILKIISIVIAIFITLLIGGKIFIYYHFTTPPIEEGLYEFNYCNIKDADIYCSITIKPIDEKEYISANGINVVEDTSHRKKNKYYFLDINTIINGEEFEIEFINLKVRPDSKVLGDDNRNSFVYRYKTSGSDLVIYYNGLATSYREIPYDYNTIDEFYNRK